MTTTQSVIEEKELKEYLYQFANEVTDRDGMVDSKESSDFNAEYLIIRDYLTSKLEEKGEQEFKEILELFEIGERENFTIQDVRDIFRGRAESRHPKIHL